MRRWLVDRIRLALRWGFKRWGGRLFAFAFFPTKREMDAIARTIVGQACSDLVAEFLDKPEDRQKLH